MSERPAFEPRHPATALWCKGCRRPMEPGEALTVIPVNGEPEWYVHRPSADSSQGARSAASCFSRVIGPASLFAISEYDPAAARRYDAEHAAGRRPVNRDAQELAFALKRSEAGRIADLSKWGGYARRPPVAVAAQAARPSRTRYRGGADGQ